jgi:pyruvate/2-oxoglutarate dehydrogenase complex dihydrolipoamide acyltransferase (E2) component
VTTYPAYHVNAVKLLQAQCSLIAAVAAAPPAAKAAPKAASAPTSAASAGGRVVASPMAKNMADEMGIDISTVVGTGPDGRITASDVQNAALLAFDVITWLTSSNFRHTKVERERARLSVRWFRDALFYSLATRMAY